ncbi:MAG: phage tail protein [Undibacterium sp.]|uniref:phage baseplate assembly protein n=1 Tax=Undibacterium sp. TaxID=1914977 RepID=UPI0027264609|nr:phage tail protein [Undibacterium sp.]MDO8654185.1 phage tail protein [Undibacterium sp.]
MSIASNATRDNEEVALLIGGLAHTQWESYEIDSDLLTPADAWDVSIGFSAGVLPDSVTAGAPVQIKIGSDLVMTGRVDTLAQSVSKNAHDVRLCGRDSAAQLVDCSAPIFVRKMATLDEIVSSIVRPLGITNIRIDAKTSAVREKINIEPGDTAWDALKNAAEANGLWPWFDPDGTLVVGGPDYTKAPVAVLSLNFNGSNVESLSRTDNVADRFSEITVLGQTHATAQEGGKHNLKGVAKDSGITWPRPKIIVDHETDTPFLCEERARKLMGDSRLQGFTLTAKVFGHRIDAPGESGDGQLWMPGQRVRVVSDVLKIDGIFFLMGRKFCRSRSSGTTTELTLKEDGVWVIDAHPHKRKHRLGKNSLAGEVYDASNGATP